MGSTTYFRCDDLIYKCVIFVANGSAGEPWPAGPSVPSAGSTAAGGRNQRGSPADPFARPSAVGRTFVLTGAPLAARPVQRGVRQPSSVLQDHCLIR